MGQRILCLLPRMLDPGVARRIDMLKQAGFQVQALAFERGERWGRPSGCPTESLGKIPDGSFLGRIHRLIRSLPKVRRSMGCNDMVYAFNAELACLALMAGAGARKPLALEVAAIAGMQLDPRWGPLIRALERLILRRCRLLVLTAKAHCPYYRAWLGVDIPGLVIENKVDAAFAAAVRADEGEASFAGEGQAPPAPRPKESAAKPPLRLGWFGKLADEWTMQVVEALAERAPQRFSAVLAGTPDGRISNFSRRIERHPNIDFRGGFNHPRGLVKLHREVSLVAACYPPSAPYGWARTNRFYDACLFRTPLIVRKGCSDADQVRRHDIGLVVNAADVDRAAAQILDISTADCSRWRANMAALPAQVYSALNEADALQGALRNLANS